MNNLAIVLSELNSAPIAPPATSFVGLFPFLLFDFVSFFFLSSLFLLLDGGELATVAAPLARGAAVQHLLLLPKLATWLPRCFAHLKKA